MKRLKGRVQPEMLVGISAVFIGVCALAVSLYETSLMREEQRAAVIPLLELSRSFYIDQSGEGKTRLYLQAENVGIGPARIADFRVTVDAKPQLTWRSTMQALLGRDEPVAYGQSTINRRTVPPDRLVTMFDLRTTALTSELVAEFDRLELEACFCSVFDECWTTRYSTLGAALPVEACPHSVDESFQE